MPRFAVRRLDDIPRVPDSAFPWYPLQHHFGLTAFGANLFAAEAPGDELVEEHDETASGQEELYLVLSGAAVFVLDGDEYEAAAVTAVAVGEPAVRRRATALEAGTTVLVVGGEARGEFRSTWRAEWFERVPRA